MKLPAADAAGDAIQGFLRNFAPIAVLIALVAVSIRVSVQKRHHQSGYFVYVDAGRAWREGGHLYTSLDDLPPGERERAKRRVARAGEWQVRDSGAWGGYRYSPTAAILFVPLSYLPGPVGEVVWRAFLACVCFGALYWCSRVGVPRPLARRDWPIFFLLVLWSVAGCLNNGQSSTLLVGCLIGAVAACCTGRWWIAAILVTIPTMLKLYPVAFGLLLAALYPRQFSWRFAITLVAAFALPFILRPHGMWVEHQRWWWHLTNDAKTLPAITSWDQDVRILLYRAFGVVMSMRAFMVLQFAVGVFIGAVCIAGRWAGWPRRVLIPRAYGMTAVWMTAFGMATEPSTYILVAPALAWSLWEVWLRPSPTAAVHGAQSPGGALSRAVLGVAYLLFLTAYVFLWFPWGHLANSYGPEPLAGVLILSYLVARSWRELRGRIIRLDLLKRSPSELSPA